MSTQSPQPVAHHGEVVEVTWLTPGMVRVVLGGPGLDAFEPTTFTDQYVNALFVPDGAPYSVPFDVEATKELPAAQRPKGRRYTVRSWDADSRRLTIDFVAHGDVGLAGRWAARAVPGDRLQVLGPSGAYRPAPDADWYLMVGDESALPAIAASLEAVPSGREVVVVAVVDDADHELTLTSPGNLRVVWVHRSSAPGDADLLLRAVEALPRPDGTPELFVHGEAGEVRAVRRHLLATTAPSSPSISPYWRRAHTDEEWRAIKRDWLAAVQAETPVAPGA